MSLQGRDSMVGSKLGSHLWEDYWKLVRKYRWRARKLTVQCRVHATQIHQQAHHCHILCGLMLSQKLISQDLASLAAPCHRINVQIGKGLLRYLLRLVAVGEDSLVVLKDRLKKLILDVLPPEWLPVVLLEMLHLIAAVHGIVLRATRWWFLALARRSRLGGGLPRDLAWSSNVFVFSHLVCSSRRRRCIARGAQDVLQ